MTRHLGAIFLAALVIALAAVQAWYSTLSSSRILEEELAEAVRNPLWVSRHLVYDGVSSNVGWYGLLAGLYTIAGFSLFGAKVLRVLLAVAALACTAHMSTAWLGWRRAALPLAVIGLSPAVLYFNTLMTTYGMDAQWMPIVAWLLWRASRLPAPWDRAGYSTLGLATSLASLTWPVCVFYVPLIAIAVWLVARRRDGVTAPATAAVAGAALPFFASALWLRNAGTWLHDPETGSGVFRGGGAGLVSSLHQFLANAWWIITDLTVSGTSYYFWLPVPDLSGITGLLSAATVVAMLPTLWHSGRTIRVATSACIFFGIATAAVAALATGPPGLRRATSALVAFYVLYVLCWRAATAAWQAAPTRWIPKLQLALLSLLLVHHVAAVPRNARSLTAIVPGVERWFTVAPTPQESLSRWKAAVLAGEPLDCRRIDVSSAESCRYSSVYSAVALSLGDNPPLVVVYDLRTGQYLQVTPETWPGSLSR